MRQKRRLIDNELDSCNKSKVLEKSSDIINEPICENNFSFSSSSCMEDEPEVPIDVTDNASCDLVLGNNDDLLQPVSDFQKKMWTQTFNISHKALSSLLKILQLYGHNELSADARTLLRSPRNTFSKIVEVNGGHSAYFGIKNGLLKSLKKYYITPPSLVKLNFNIDGLPLTKSSGSQFWPILCAVVDSNIYTEPFVVSIFHGYKKPIDINDFLRSFVNETKRICSEGIMIGCKK